VKDDINLLKDIDYLKNKSDEKYVFYNFVTADLDEASHSLSTIKQYKQGFMIMTLIKNAIIAYSRPFGDCKGTYSKYKIGIKFVPKNLRKLHKQVLHHRNCIIAHTDISVRTPKLGAYGIMFKGKGYYYEDYLELANKMPELISEVRKAVHKVVLEYKNISNKHATD
jgi:hypothetical protein